MAVVIGTGMDGLRAAAMLASTGTSVLFLQEAETPHGLVHPEVEPGNQRVHLDASLKPAVELALGRMVDAPPIKRAIARKGSVHLLPLSPMAVAGLFERDQLSKTGRHFVERRLRNGLIPLTGEGQEERTYREWVVRRMGEPAYRHIYSSYAQRRWGLSGDDLSVAVARAHHNPHHPPTSMVVDGGPAAAIAHAVDTIERNGGEIQTSANVRGLKVVDGRVAAVRVGRRNVSTDGGPVWIARTPSVVAGWLGDSLPSGQHVDAGLLRTNDRVHVSFDVERRIDADEIHLLDADDVAYRVTQGRGERHFITFENTISPFDPDPDVELLAQRAHALGWVSADPVTARVERIHEWVPLWAPVVHPRLRRLSLAFRSLGVVMVGRRGTFSPIDPGTELMLADRYAGEADPDQREAMRVLVAPPVKDDDLDASFRDFIWR